MRKFYSIIEGIFRGHDMTTQQATNQAQYLWDGVYDISWEMAHTENDLLDSRLKIVGLRKQLWDLNAEKDALEAEMGMLREEYNALQELQVTDQDLENSRYEANDFFEEVRGSVETWINQLKGTPNE